MANFRRAAKVTTILGVTFRSRLESRIAFTFDALGVQWRYEPQIIRISKKLCYLPDFLCCFMGTTFWTEVKPKKPNRKEVAKAEGLAQVTAEPVIITMNDPFHKREVACRIYYQEGDRTCWDEALLRELLGVSFQEYQYAVNVARDRFRIVMEAPGRLSNERRWPI